MKRKVVRMQIIEIADRANDIPAQVVFSEDVALNDPKLYMSLGTIIDISHTTGIYTEFRVVDKKVVFSKKGTGRKWDLYNFYVQRLDKEDPASRYVNFSEEGYEEKK